MKFEVEKLYLYYMLSGLDCDSCESKLHLAYGEKILTLSSGEKIAVEHTPFLVCDVCQKRYISPLLKSY